MGVTGRDRLQDEIEALCEQAQVAMTEGRDAEALQLVQAAFALAKADDVGRHIGDFSPLYAWEALAGRYMPAWAALARVRDTQAHRLLAGDVTYGKPWSETLGAHSRFGLVVRLNEILNDAQSTHAVFVQFAARMPERARREAFRALPAVVEAGDFVLGERYLPDPIGFLDEMNRTAREWPLSPFVPASMRSFANLSNFARELRLRGAILRGLGREAESDALLSAGLDGLATDEMRDWVRRDLAAPGAIIRESSALHMAFIDAGNQNGTEKNGN